MTIRISETIHKWMGWCPVKAGMVAPGGIEGYETESGQSPGDPERIGDERIVNYGFSGTSLLNLLLVGAGISAIVSFIKLTSLIFIGADAIVLFCILLTSAFILAYNDFKKTTIESLNGTLVIHRPIFKAVVIPKDEISTVEMHNNHQTVAYLLTAALSLVIIPVYSVTGVYDRYWSWASGVTPTLPFIIYLGYFLTITVFFLAVFNSVRIRQRYPKALVITTVRKKKLEIFAKTPEELTDLQERFFNTHP